MNVWNKYRDYFFSGEWHIHTSFTDGKNTIYDYAETANELQIPLLAFTEHVRKNLDYNYDDFLKEISFAKKKFPHIILLSGIEAKVLPDGGLDCPEGVLEKADYKLFTFHSFPENLEVYFSSVKNVIRNYNVDAWAHPGLFFKKYKNLELSDAQLNEIFELMIKHNILLEFNFKYNLPKTDWINKYFKISNGKNFIIGSDAHSVDDLLRVRKIKQDYTNHSKKIFPDSTDLFLFFNWFAKYYQECTINNQKNY